MKTARVQSTDPPYITKTRIPDVLSVKVPTLPASNEVMNTMLDKLDRIYSTNRGFGIIFDLSDIEINMSHWAMLMQSGEFFIRMDTSKRLKASKGIAIIVGSDDTRKLINQAVALFPSPVTVTCCRNMHQAVCSFQSVN